MAKINDQCIACGTCVSLASNIFGWDDAQNKPFVKKQPETPEEVSEYETAKSSCPVGAIED